MALNALVYSFLPQSQKCGTERLNNFCRFMMAAENTVCAYYIHPAVQRLSTEAEYCFQSCSSVWYAQQEALNL